MPLTGKQDMDLMIVLLMLMMVLLLMLLSIDGEVASDLLDHGINARRGRRRSWSI